MARYVVVASPRSGTGYVASALQAVGVPCGHEQYFNLRTGPAEFLAAPEPAGDSSWLAVPFLDQLPADVRVVHLVRDPLKVIRSLLELRFLDLDAAGQSRRLGIQRQFTEFALRHCPQLTRYATELERAAWFYWHWAERIAAYAREHEVLRVRLEELDAERLAALARFIGVDFADLPADAAVRLADVPKDTNSKRGEKFMLAEQPTWAGLPPELRELAASYGYRPVDAVPAPPEQANVCEAAFDELREKLYQARLAWRGEHARQLSTERAQRGEIVDLRRLVRDTQVELQSTRHNLKQTRRELKERREQIQELDTRLRNARGELAQAVETVRREQARGAELEQRGVRLQQEVDTLQAAAARQAEQLRQSEQALAEREQALRKAQGDLGGERAATRREQQRAARLSRDLEYARLSLKLRTEEVRYRLGDALVRAARPSRDTLLLPFRMLQLLRDGLRRRRERKRPAAAPTPAARPPAARVAGPPAEPEVAAPASAAPAEAVVRVAERRAADVLPRGNGRTTTAARVPGAAPGPTPRRARGYLFFCVNGAGLGHLTRCLAIARRIRRLDPAAPVYFLSSSQALELISREGMIAYHIPPASRYGEQMRASEWSALLHRQIQLIVETHQPDVFVYDGVFPYRGLLDALEQLHFAHTAMVLRLRHKHDRLQELADRLAIFDQLIFPGEAGVNGDLAELAPPELAQLNCRVVEPIICLDREELLPRAEVRARLGLPLDRKAVYVQLGAGNINDTGDLTQRVLAALAARDDVDVVLAESPIAERTVSSDAHVHVLRHYPNALYYNGFDLAVTAVGYNTFHEQIHYGVPSVLLPNLETRTDDQVGRALAAHRALAAVAVLRPELLEDSLALALGDEVRAEMSEKARALVPTNGAATAARLLVDAARVESSAAAPDLLTPARGR